MISDQFAHEVMAAAMDQAQGVVGGAQVQVMPPSSTSVIQSPYDERHKESFEVINPFSCILV